MPDVPATPREQEPSNSPGVVWPFAILFSTAIVFLLYYAQFITRDDFYEKDYESIIRDGRITIIPFDKIYFFLYGFPQQANFLLSLVLAFITSAFFLRIARDFSKDAFGVTVFGVIATVIFYSTDTLLIADHVLLMKAVQLIFAWFGYELWIAQLDRPFRASVLLIVLSAIASAFVIFVYQATIVLPCGLMLLTLLRPGTRLSISDFLKKFVLFLVAYVIAFELIDLLVKSPLYPWELRPRALISLDPLNLINPLTILSVPGYRLRALRDLAGLLPFLAIAAGWVYVLFFRRYSTDLFRKAALVAVLLVLMMMFNPILAGDYLNQRANDELNMLLLVFMAGLIFALLAWPPEGQARKGLGWIAVAVFLAFVVLTFTVLIAERGSVRPWLAQALMAVTVSGALLVAGSLLMRRNIGITTSLVLVVAVCLALGMQQRLIRLQSLIASNAFDAHTADRILTRLQEIERQNATRLKTVYLSSMPLPLQGYYSVLKSYSGHNYLKSRSVFGYNVVTFKYAQCKIAPGTTDLFQIELLPDKKSARVCFTPRPER